MKACWISAGVSSFVAGWLARDTVDEYIYIDIADQHRDSIRFIRDCEIALGKKIKILRSMQYSSVEDAILGSGFVCNQVTHFHPCTNFLKKRVRKEWEEQHKDCDITYVWGMDVTEKKRADSIVSAMPQFEHEFPLIEQSLTKQDAHGICNRLGVKRPLMYDLGYNNNNCIGCVRGGAGYWNKIRQDFPEVFEQRAKMERKIGNAILKDADGKPIFLDELDDAKGRVPETIMEECGIFCMLQIEGQ